MELKAIIELNMQINIRLLHNIDVSCPVWNGEAGRAPESRLTILSLNPEVMA